MTEEIKEMVLDQISDEFIHRKSGRWTAADQAAVEEARAMDPGTVLPDEQIRLGDQIQGADETRFEYAARMESMRHLYVTSRPRWRKRDSEQANAELDAAVARVNDLQTPTLLYSFGFDGEQLLTVYNALRTYLRVSVQQDNEDLETIQRIAGMLIDIKPRAVEASKHLALKAVGMEAK